MLIGVIGNGFVGQATQLLKCPDVEIMVYDIDPTKCIPENTQLKDMLDCEMIFICVPTPMRADSSCNTIIVEIVINDLRKIDYKNFIVVRSTVPPGFSDQNNVYFMPEFLTERNWVNDFKNCNLWVFGLNNSEISNEVSNEQSNSLTHDNFKNKIESLINLAAKNGCINNINISFVSNKEAELCKYARNCYLAVKISYFNEIQKYCLKENLDYDHLKEIITADDRIGPSHADVPGPDGKCGFGGICLPKDINALIHEFESKNIEPSVMKAARYRNDNLDRVEQDWKVIGRSIL